MLKLRSQLATYQEHFFLVGFLILFSLHSVGLGMTDVKWMAGVGLLLLSIKLVITDYTKRELAIIAGMLFAGMVPLVINSDKMLILTIITIIAVKNCAYQKIFLCSAVSRAVLMTGKIGLVVVGILPDGYNGELTKYDFITQSIITYEIPNFGYSHPNYLYLGAVSVALLIIVVMKEKAKWYIYLILAAGLYWLYRVTYCRTGFAIWIGILGMLILYKIVKEIPKAVKCYMYFLGGIPILLTVATVVISYYHNLGENWAQWINMLVNGRFQRWSWQTKPLYQMILPQYPWKKLDNGYIYQWYNFGWLIMLLLIGWLTYCSYLLIQKQLYYEIISIAATTGYLIGEAMPLSSTWNPCILLLAIGIYGYTEGKATNVPKGITD